MKSDSAANNERTGISSMEDASSPEQLQGVCTQLRERVRSLEEECIRERQARLAAQGERDQYHRCLVALLRERLAETDATTDDDLDRLVEDTSMLKDFDEELRQLLQEQ